MPMVLTMRQPPDMRAEAHGQVAAEHDPDRSLVASGEVVAEIALRVEQHHDDAHGLLRVVAAVAEAEGRRRQQLQRGGTSDRLAPGFILRKSQEHRNHHDAPSDIADHRRDDDEERRRADLRPTEDAETRLARPRRR